MYDLPLDTELSNEELTAAVAEALTDPQINPDQGLVPNTEDLLMRLGVNYHGTDIVQRLWAANGGQNTLEFRFAELCWAWVSRGILVPSGQSFFPTDRGRSVLEDVSNDARLVLTATGIRRALEERCPGIDGVALQYAELAQDCFLSGHYEASVVLLGAATELTVLQLVDAMNSSRTALGTREIKERNALTRLRKLKDLIEANRRNIRTLIAQAGGESKWVDEVPGLLDSSNAIRITRNDAGHPTRIIARREEAQGLLALFPTVAEALVKVAEGLVPPPASD